MGQLHPSLLKSMDVSGHVYLFQIRQDALMTLKVPCAQPISKYPEVQRDLAFVVEESVSSQSLIDAVFSVDSDILTAVELFDVYRGQGVESNQKSIALTMRVQHAERTLQDEEVDALVVNVLKAAKLAVNAELR